MRIVEFIHDQDHPGFSNVDLWIKENGWCDSKKIKVYEAFNSPDPESYDLLVLHGGAQHVWNKEADLWLYDEIAYVKKALEVKKPVIGFCLGSQIIADALGANVYESPEKEVGFLKVIIRPEAMEHPLVEGLKEGFESFMWHSDHYELPNNCITLGYTQAAQHQIYASEKYPAVGFQFHPEYTLDIIRYYFDTCYDEEWKGGKYIEDKEKFLKQLQGLSLTYHLFEKLMNNTIRWFNEKFNTGLDTD